MERDCVMSQRMIHYFDNQSANSVDTHYTYVCNTCGSFASEVEVKKKYPDELNNLIECDVEPEIRPLRTISSGEPDDLDSFETMKVFFCSQCNSFSNISRVEIPHAFKMLLLELMNIASGIQTHYSGG
jgi:hypothetical protein